MLSLPFSLIWDSSLDFSLHFLLAQLNEPLKDMLLPPRMLVDGKINMHILPFCFIFYTFGGCPFWKYSLLRMSGCLLVWCLQARNVEGPAFAMTVSNNIHTRAKGEKNTLLWVYDFTSRKKGQALRWSLEVVKDAFSFIFPHHVTCIISIISL